MLQHRQIARTGVFGGNFGNFLSPTRFAILLGGPVVIFSLLKIICSIVKCSRKTYVTNVARLRNPLVTCSSHVPERNWFGIVRSFLVHSGRGRFHSFFDLLWFLLMIESFDEEQVALVVTIAWLLWSNCNSVRHGGTRKHRKLLFNGLLTT